MAKQEIQLQGIDGRVEELVLTNGEAPKGNLEDCVRLLFPQDGEAVPRLRFKGFEGEWKRMSFGELYEHCIVKNDLSFGPDKIISVANMFFLQDESNSDEDYLRTYNVFRLGDIAFEGHSSKEFAHGRFVENTIGDGIVSHIFDVFRPKSEKYDLMFWKYAINNELLMGKILTRCTKASTMMNDIVAEDFYKETFLVPSYEEQKKIGELLVGLDTQIEYYQEQFDNLKQLKSACLETMFPQKSEGVPMVRFKGFEGDWKVVPLSDCLSVNNERNTDGKYGKNEVLSVSDDYGVVNQIEFLGRSFAGKSVANYRVLNHGDIVYTKSPLKAKPFGIIKVNEGESGIVSTLYAVYTPKDGVSARFINYYFAPAQRMNKYIHPLVNKGAKNDMKVSDENVLKGFIKMPSTFEEQEQIARFFSELEGRISAQQQQLERLKQMKQSCLRLLFADNQSITPPLRFKGFNGEWIMIRFSDIATIRRGLTYSPDDITERGVRVLRSSNIDEDAFTVSSSDVFVDAQCVNIPLANNNDILVTAANGSPRLVGKHCLVECGDDRMVPGGFMFLVSSDEAEFLNACMGASWYRKFLVNGVSGGNGAIGNLSKDELEKCEFYIPKEKEERDRIASFFTSLDKQISLQSQQVEKLQQLKKACLSQMFE